MRFNSMSGFYIAVIRNEGYAAQIFTNREHSRRTLQNFVPFINTTNGVAFIGTPTGSTAVVANTVSMPRPPTISICR
jgi:hypothetical protein